MKTRSPFAALFLLVCVSGGYSSDVSTSQKRMVTVDLARSLLTPRVSTESAEKISSDNPFVTKREVLDIPSVPTNATTSISDRELLSKLAATLTPSGTIMLGDTALLLVGQKRLKVGDFLSIVFQGRPYEVEIVGIDRISFTLRLNKEEITRPIK